MSLLEQQLSTVCHALAAFWVVNTAETPWFQHRSTKSCKELSEDLSPTIDRNISGF